MDVSIIIPSFNRLWSLPAAIESCRNTRCKSEIIVIDDGSTDGTWDWLEQQKEISIFKQPNWGKCWAVNKGFELCAGKYVKFLDSDDKIAKNTIDEQFQIAEANASDIVVSGYQLVDQYDQLLNQQTWVECDDFIAQQLGECNSSHYSAYLFNRSFISDIPHRPDFAYRDDRMFVIETALRFPKVHIHPGFSLLHTMHNNSRLQITRRLVNVVQNFQHLNIYKKILNQLHQDNQLTSRRKKAAVNALWPLCQWIAKNDMIEAANLLKWIYELDPDFEIPEKGILGFLYRTLGINNTHKMLSVKRFLKYKLLK